MSEFSRRRPSWTRREPYEPQWEKDRRVKIQKYLAEHGDKAELPEGTTAQQWLDPKWKGPMRNPDFFERMEQEKDVGLQAARVRQRLLEQQVFTHDRFQASWAMRNMVKALNLHVWRNTLEDWQRLFETQIILAARARKAKGGPMFGPPIGGKVKGKVKATISFKENPGGSHGIVAQGKGFVIKNSAGMWLCYDYFGFNWGQDPDTRIFIPTRADAEYFVGYREKNGRWPKPSGGIHGAQKAVYAR